MVDTVGFATIALEKRRRVQAKRRYQLKKRTKSGSITLANTPSFQYSSNNACGHHIKSPCISLRSPRRPLQCIRECRHLKLGNKKHCTPNVIESQSYTAVCIYKVGRRPRTIAWKKGKTLHAVKTKQEIEKPKKKHQYYYLMKSKRRGCHFRDV